MKYRTLHLAAIFLMTIFTGQGGRGHDPLAPPPGSATDHIVYRYGSCDWGEERVGGYEMQP